MNLTKHQMAALNNCLKCSICVDSCPVAAVNPEFPGPKQLGIDWLRIAQEDGRPVSAAVDYCSNCKTCETVCPAGVLVGTLNQLAKSSLPKSGAGLRAMIFADPARLGKLIQLWPQAGNLATGLAPVKLIMEKTIGISAKSTLPAYSSKRFARMLRLDKSPGGEGAREVLYFPGCFARYNRPEIGLALVKILTKLNYRVTVPDFQCCGQPAISNARLQDTRKFAEHNLRILAQQLQTGSRIVFSCPSCLLTFKEEYLNMLGLEAYAQFSASLLDAGHFLALHRQELSALIARPIPANRGMVYHEPCHLRASGQGTAGLSLLNSLTGDGIVPLEAGCCGLAGSYGLKAEKQQTAQAIGSRVKTAIERARARAVVTECGMCSVQLHNLSQLPVYHPLELLAKLVETA
jgi:glycerol-3-phosphate dehydrogenase subunit C